MQITQLNPYSMNVPKLEASVIMSSVLGKAASLSCDVANQTLDHIPCGSDAMAESETAVPSANTSDKHATPTMIEMMASVQMARCGLRFLSCRRPKCSGTS